MRPCEKPLVGLRNGHVIRLLVELHARERDRCAPD
tara:strand:- start:525 stop:629 length:105 start_codon:yes stop_codon:yes gene_type:complete